jgi:hypothetical protein
MDGSHVEPHNSTNNYQWCDLGKLPTEEITDLKSSWLENLLTFKIICIGIISYM